MSPGTFTITQIELSITGIGADTADVEHNNSFTRTRNGNVFTFSSSGEVAIDVAETFLKSLKFGINSHEPTGPVTLKLSMRSSEGETITETAIRTITEENDPVEVVGLAEGEQFTVQVADLVSSSAIAFMATVNDGGDGSDIKVVIAPDTFNLPTVADPSVMGTLTLSYSLVREDFTLNVISDVALAPTEVMTTLSFSDGRSTETRGITIAIVIRGLTLLAIDDNTIAETAVEKEEGSEQQFVGIYPDATTATEIITEVGVLPRMFMITQIALNVTGINVMLRSGIVLILPEPKMSSQMEMNLFLLILLEWRQVMQRPSLNHWSSALITMNRLVFLREQPHLHFQ